jgi:tryptophanyl-tRNA synthetase
LRIFSGIQPTGRKHLGNHLGAIRQYVEGPGPGEAIYCIVDLHATTVPYDPAVLRERLFDTTAILLAAGLDPGRCILFRQADVPEHTELCWLLCSVTALGELNRMHQFRDKSVAQRELVSAGLLFYPVLQAADVLAYRADEVPVGEDQREHLELMREIARRFNARFGGGEEVLKVPEHRIPEVGARVMDLQDPTRKMSTTGGTQEGTVYVLDDDAAVTKKFRRAVTDSGTEIPARAGEARRHEPHRGAGRHAQRHAGAGRGGPLRRPWLRRPQGRGRRGRRGGARSDPGALRAASPRPGPLGGGPGCGAEKAQVIAADTLQDVRERMGVGRSR